jgi:hypothetical protein
MPRNDHHALECYPCGELQPLTHTDKSLLAVIAANAQKSRTPARLYACETIFEWLAQDLEAMTAALGPFIQEQDAVMGQRHVARHRHMAPADQPHIGDRVVGGAKRAGW